MNLIYKIYKNYVVFCQIKQFMRLRQHYIENIEQRNGEWKDKSITNWILNMCDKKKLCTCYINHGKRRGYICKRKVKSKDFYCGYHNK